MAINEHFDNYPEELIDNVKKNIEEDRGLKLVPNYRKYIYLDGRYGDKSPFAGKYAKEFPASITGGNKATRFRDKNSYAKNKIYIDEEKKICCIFITNAWRSKYIWRLDTIYK